MNAARHTRAAAIAPDPELQPYLARDALRGLDRLLTAQHAGETIPCEWVGAMIRLIVQASEPGTSPPVH